MSMLFRFRVWRSAQLKKRLYKKGGRNHSTFTAKEQAQRIWSNICLETLGYNYTATGSNIDFCVPELADNALHHGLNMGCKSQARVLRMFMPDEVTISKITTTAPKIASLKVIWHATVSSYRQVEAQPALICLRKTAQKNPPAYCKWMGDVQFSLGRVCVVCSQNLQSERSNPAELSGEAGVPLDSHKTKSFNFSRHELLDLLLYKCLLSIHLVLA